MKNAQEEVLIILAEECAEVIQEASKCIRFGLTPENVFRLNTEIGQLKAMIDLCDKLVTQDMECEKTAAYLEKLQKLQVYSTFLKDE